MAFNATKIVSKTSDYTALYSDSQINVSPSAATTITLPQISALAASGFGSSKALYIQNVSGDYAVTVTADTTKPDYIAVREKTDEAGPVIRTFASIALTSATDYVLLEADPSLGYWWVKEMGLSTSYHGAKALAPQEMNLSLVGTSAANGLEIRINDLTTGANSTNGMYIYKYSGGAHTDGYGAALNIDHVLGAAQVTIAYGASINMMTANSATLTGTYVFGLGIDIASDIAAFGTAGIYISKSNETAGTAYDTSIWIGLQSAVVQTASSIMHIHGARHPQWLLDLTHDATSGFFTKDALSGSIVGRLVLHVKTTTYYIPLYTS
jgi:hypothetical protein